MRDILLHRIHQNITTSCISDSEVYEAVLGLNRISQDIDLATKLRPEQIVQVATQHHLVSIPTGIKHGTITVLNGNQKIEITTLRVDTETDGRHAKVMFTDSWILDASRRDLTFNAMYLDENNMLYDYFNGYDDLCNGIVKFIGNPADRIQEDVLRILRFFRFYIYYGKSMDINSLNACYQYQELITNLSKERITQEIIKIIQAPNTTFIIPILSNEIFRTIIHICPNYILTSDMNINVRFKLLYIKSNYLKLSNKFLKYQSIIEPFSTDDIAYVRLFLAEYGYEVLHDKIIITKIINNIDIPQIKTVELCPIRGQDCLSRGIYGHDIHTCMQHMKYWWYKQEIPSLKEFYNELESWIEDYKKDKEDI